VERNGPRRVFPGYEQRDFTVFVGDNKTSVLVKSFVVPPLGGPAAAYLCRPHFPPEGGTTNDRLSVGASSSGRRLGRIANFLAGSGAGFQPACSVCSWVLGRQDACPTWQAGCLPHSASKMPNSLGGRAPDRVRDADGYQRIGLLGCLTCKLAACGHVAASPRQEISIHWPCLALSSTASQTF
jgi:hypothetical protein